ncbi:MAG: hypothetical protein FJW39_29640 [Acidobacteria bacterium]|nr:hypothetical protein [Acidobacteriota bacterium]
MPFVLVWAAVTLVVIGLAVYRWVLGLHEDDSIHIGDVQAEREQMSLASRMGLVDQWGKALTVVAFAGGVAIGAALLYTAWTGGKTL